VLENTENLGYARAMNQALRHGKPADVLVALNPDTEPPARSLSELVERLLTDPAIGVVVPRLLNSDGTDQHSVYRFPSALVAFVVSFCPALLLRRGVGRRFWLEGFSDHRQRIDVDWAIGAVHVLRASALRDEAPYDERWFMYAEDLELCWRMTRAGWRVRLEGDVGVPHVGNASGAQAWGSERTARWLVPTYECYALVCGVRAARAWAAVNAAGLVWLRVKWRTLAALRPSRFRHLAGWAADAVTPLAIHRRVLRHGVRSLSGLAGGPPSPSGGPGTVNRSQ
jgi:GT2 family glycosyltransferase